MLRIRVEAAASARWARPAPWVMLPASATWRNRLRSARSKRNSRAFWFDEGKIREILIAYHFSEDDVSLMTKQAYFTRWEPESVCSPSRDSSVPAALADCGRGGHRLPTISSLSSGANMAEAKTSHVRDN